MKAEIQSLLMNWDYVSSEKEDIMYPNNCFRCIGTTKGKRADVGCASSRQNSADKGLEGAKQIAANYWF